MEETAALNTVLHWIVSLGKDTDYVKKLCGLCGIDNWCNKTKLLANDLDASSCNELVPTGSYDQEQTTHHFTAHKTGEQSLRME